MRTTVLADSDWSGTLITLTQLDDGTLFAERSTDRGPERVYLVGNPQKTLTEGCDGVQEDPHDVHHVVTRLLTLRSRDLALLDEALHQLGLRDFLDLFAKRVGSHSVTLPHRSTYVKGIVAEFCHFARRGNLAHLSQAPTRWFTWKRVGWTQNDPAAKHSRKPDAFLDLVESVSPGPYLELFARRQRLGWDTWGDEALDHVEVGA